MLRASRGQEPIRLRVSRCARPLRSGRRILERAPLGRTAAEDIRAPRGQEPFDFASRAARGGYAPGVVFSSRRDSARLLLTDIAVEVFAIDQREDLALA